MITVGELDTPIQIQQPAFDGNANYGGIQKATWDTAGSVTRCWAYMIWKGGGEREEGDQQVGEQKVDFYIRYETFKDAIQPSWRIRHSLESGTYVYYYIEKIAHIDGRHKITRLTAVQKDNN
jgi:head-tail adaptor